MVIVKFNGHFVINVISKIHSLRPKKTIGVTVSLKSKLTRMSKFFPLLKVLEILMFKATKSAGKKAWNKFTMTIPSHRVRGVLEIESRCVRRVPFQEGEGQIYRLVGDPSTFSRSQPLLPRLIQGWGQPGQSYLW